MAVHAIATVLFFPFFQMDPERFLGKDEHEKITLQIEEDAVIEAPSVLQVAIFFSLLSNWWLNDQRHVSSLLIFVGSTEIECMLKP